MTPSEQSYRKCRRCETLIPIDPVPDKRKSSSVLCKSCNAKKARDYRSRNAEHHREYNRNYRLKNLERYREMARENHKKNRDRNNEKSRIWHRENRDRLAERNRNKRMKSFNADQFWYDAKLREQDLGCAICGAKNPKGPARAKRFAIDHDHSCCGEKKACEKCRRGLLCVPCNTFLARIEGEWLTRALAYLAQYKR